MVVAFGSRSGSCPVYFIYSDLFISGIDYYTQREVFESLRVYCIYGMSIGLILFIVW